MKMSIRSGMDAKEIAILHYRLLIENNFDEWVKTIRKSYQKNASRRGSRPANWWETGRKRVDEQEISNKFKNEDTVQRRTETRVKFFFHRLDREGKPSGTGQVPITLIRDPEDNEEWRVEVSSW